MPNANIVNGARPYGRMYEQTRYTAQSTVFKGDLVKKNAAGTVERATAGDALLGVAIDSAAAGERVLVADSPDQKFVLQCTGAAVAAQTNLGLNASIVVGTANVTYKRSGMELDDATLAATSTLAIRVIALEPAVDNEFGSKAKVICKINVHQNAAASVAGV